MAYPIAVFGKSTDDPSRFERYVRPARFTLNTKHPLAQGLVLAGLSGKGARLHDYSGNGNHGKLVNMEESDWLYSSQIGRMVIDLDGSIEYVDFGKHLSVGLASGTMSCWTRYSANGLYPFIMGDINWSTDVGGVCFADWSTTGSPAFLVGNASTYASAVGTATMSGTLRHLTGVWNSSGIKLYIDGVLTASDSTGLTPTSSGLSFMIGRDPSSLNYYLLGQVGDPMLWSRNLSIEEIQRLASPTNVMLDGLIVPDEPDRSVTKRRVAVVQGVTFEKVKQRPEQFEIDYDHPLAKGLIFAGLGSKPGSSRFNDSSLFKRHGALTNMESSDWVWDSTLDRFVINFGGTDEYITVPFDVAHVKFTLSIWFWTAPISTTQIMMSIGDNGATGRLYMANEATTGTDNLYCFRVGDAGGPNVVSRSTQDYTDSQWNHALLLSTGNNYIRCYLNGVAGGESTSSSNSLTPNFLCIGASQRNTVTDFFTGMVADPMVWDRHLSVSEILDLAIPKNARLSGMIKPIQGTTKYFRGVTLSDAYTLKPPAVHVSHGNARPQHFTLDYNHPLAKGLVFAGLGAHAGSTRYHDSSAYGNAGTLTNMEPATDWVWDSTLNRFALQFDGVDETVVVSASNNLNSSSSWSLSFWARREAAQIGGVWNFAGGADWCLWLTAIGDMKLTDPGLIDYGGHGRLPLATWQHATVVKSGNTAYFYLNSAYLGQRDVTSLGASSGNVIIGNYVSNGYRYSGKLSDIVWYPQRAISAAEIQQLADPSNVLLSGLIKPIDKPLPLSINDRHWVGRTSDWHSADNWSRSQGGRGGAGVPNENTNVFFDTDLPEYPA